MHSPGLKTVIFDFYEEAYISLKRKLFASNVSTQSLFNYLTYLIVNNDERMDEILQELKDKKTKGKMIEKKYDYRNTESLYNLIEDECPIKK